MIQKQLEIKAQEAFLTPLLDIVSRDLKQVGCPACKLEEIRLCVEEIFVNIASYAYPGGTGMVGIIMEVQKGKVRILFRDSGIKYDPTKNKTPDIACPADERAVGGLGIYMVKNMTDKLEYEYRNRQNCLLMECSWQP